jgi:ABC-type transport system involved in multi-copper enzyme maturation permease subunit
MEASQRPNRPDTGTGLPAFGPLAIPPTTPLFVVMARTVRELLGLKRIIVLVAGGQVLALFLAQVAWKEPFRAGTMSLEMETSFLVGYYVVISFFWMTGFFLAYLVVGTSGLELIDQERRSGTLLLMVSKPISRTQFLLGKFLALVLTSIMLEAVVLPVSVLVIWASLGLDPSTVSALMGILPWIFLFSLLVILLFASLSIAISTLVRNAMIRNTAFTLVVLFVFAAGPIMRMSWPSAYEDYLLYYLDGSYNLGNAYVQVLDRAETIRLAPQSQAWLGITTGAYKAGTEEILTVLVGAEGSFDPDIGAMPPSLERTSYMAPAGSLGLTLAITVAAIGLAGLALKREEVQ